MTNEITITAEQIEQIIEIRDARKRQFERVEARGDSWSNETRWLAEYTTVEQIIKIIGIEL